MVNGESGELTLSELIASASLIQCSRCGSVFREPMLLPCLHSFCLDCLVDLLLEDGQTSEPKAKKEEGCPPRATHASLSERANDNLDGGALFVRKSGNHCDSDSDTSGSSTSDDRTPRDKENSTNVGLILREIDGRRKGGPGERSSVRPRRLRALSTKPGGTEVPARTPAVSSLYRARTAPITTNISSTPAISITDTSERPSLLRQSQRSRLRLVCPICGQAVTLKADVLLQDDDDDDGYDRLDGGNGVDRHDRGGNDSTVLETDQTSEVSGAILNQDVKNGIKNNETTKPAPMTAQKLRVLLRKTVSASLLPNYFLKSLATIHRHKNPERETTKETVHNTTLEDHGQDGTESKKENIYGKWELICAYCLSEGQRVEATSLCLDCNDLMCEACASAHRKTRVTRNHKVAPLSSIRQGLFDHDLRARDHVTCPYHPGVAVSGFCCDCLTAVCKRCKADRCRTHKIMLLQDISSKLVPELSQIQRAIVRRVPVLTSYASFLREQVTRLDNKKQQVAQEISEQAQVVHRMIEEHKQKLLSRLEQACHQQNSHISAKIRATERDRNSLSKTSAFLLHLKRLGRADEIVTSYSSIIDFYKRLVNASSSNAEGPKDGSAVPEGESRKATGFGSDGGLHTEELVVKASVGDATLDGMMSSPALATRLACVFTAGPCTETNMGILLGPLDLQKVPLDAEDSPQSKLPLTTLMPKRLPCPSVQLTFHTGIPSDQCPPYPSGLAVHPRLFALVDRENTAVKIFEKTNGNFLRSIKGDSGSSLVKPFDVVFLDKSGTTLAVSDSEAGAVRVFESLTGKFLWNFAGEVRHPRGLVVMPGTGHVVVVDGHLRHLTFHDPATGQMLRRLRPTLKTYNSSLAICTQGGSGGKEDSLDNDNDNTDTNRRCKSVTFRDKINPTQKNQKLPNASNDANDQFKSTALIDPYYIALTLSGDLVVTDQASPNLKIVDKETGDILSQTMDYGTGEEESLHPSGLCVDRYGQIFISDTNNSRVHLALPNGQLIGTVLLQDKRNTELAKTVQLEDATDLSDKPTDTADKSIGVKGADRVSDDCRQDLSVSKPLCLAIDHETDHLVVAQAGGQVKVVKYM
ncbi:tripartite motif-containing protein 3 [Elysia marginata]|uniref:Tripartite motif-containing protein 3 n=1 Tax=Elysia marginata TaxID=1093978 RepID=A0AAV4GCH6_9GAST|nr:tripartite motif-containing protein 3 [Elysia marginata]